MSREKQTGESPEKVTELQAAPLNKAELGMILQIINNPQLSIPANQARMLAKLQERVEQLERIAPAASDGEAG